MGLFNEIGSAMRKVTTQLQKAYYDMSGKPHVNCDRCKTSCPIAADMDKKGMAGDTPQAQTISCTSCGNELSYVPPSKTDTATSGTSMMPTMQTNPLDDTTLPSDKPMATMPKTEKKDMPMDPTMSTMPREMNKDMPMNKDSNMNMGMTGTNKDMGMSSTMPMDTSSDKHSTMTDSGSMHNKRPSEFGGTAAKKPMDTTSQASA
jgi:hypothetical protein